ncbi:MAG: hypothetical protein AAF702_24305 [Chloroflexota bacterium]
MKQNRQSALQVLLLYLLWFTSCGVSFINFVDALNKVRTIAIFAGADGWNLPAIDRSALFILGGIMVIFFFWCESYYRRASKISIARLFRAFGWVTGCQVLLLGIGYLIPLVLERIY